MNNHNKKIKATVIGTGKWGSALAQLFDRLNIKCTLFNKDSDTIKQLKKSNYYISYPDVQIGKNITLSDSLSDATNNCDLIIIAIPSKNMTEICHDLNKCKIQENTCILSATKGISNTGQLMTDIIKEIINPKYYGTLSGPNFSYEIIKQKPTTTNIATNNFEKTKQIAIDMSCKTFICYPIDDLLTPQICGSIKNIIAIACGISVGLNMGENAKSAIITIGIEEIVKILSHYQVDIFNLFSPSGIGDITLTCNSTLSRNFSLGIDIGHGNLGKYITKYGVAEGFINSKTVFNAYEKLGIRTSLIKTVKEIIYDDLDPKNILKILKENRDLKWMKKY